MMYRQVYGRQAYEHVRIVERVLGKPLPKGAEIHHVDGNGLNNAHSNLVVCQDKAYHKLLHYRARVKALGGNPNTERICSKCVQPVPLESFARRRANISTGLQSACIGCMNEYRRIRKGTL